MDTIIQNVLIYDGSGNLPFISDLLISSGIIKKISGLLPSQYDSTLIDGSGLALCPGFIDTHCHSYFDTSVYDHSNAVIRQGITTQIIEQNIFSLTHFENSVKTEALVSHNMLRASTISNVMEKADSNEIRRMEDILQKSIDLGAKGILFDTSHSPSSGAKENEIINLCRVVEQNNGIAVVCLQNEHNLLMESIDWAVRISAESGVRLHISDFKVIGAQNWGKGAKVIEKIEKYIQLGMEITFDSSPYTAFCANLKELIPCWTYDNDRTKFIKNINNTKTYARLIKEVSDSIEIYGGEKNIIIVCTQKHSEITGKNLAEISASTGIFPAETIINILKNDPDALAIFFALSDFDLTAMLLHPLQNICTNKIASYFPHPQLYGTFPRVLGHYVKRLGLMSMEEAIKKMTYEPAQRFRLMDRGLVREGMCADLILFDPNEIRDTNSYFNPTAYPHGIKKLWIDGEIKYS